MSTQFIIPETFAKIYESIDIRGVPNYKLRNYVHDQLPSELYNITYYNKFTTGRIEMERMLSIHFRVIVDDRNRVVIVDDFMAGPENICLAIITDDCTFVVDSRQPIYDARLASIYYREPFLGKLTCIRGDTLPIMGNDTILLDDISHLPNVQHPNFIELFTRYLSDLTIVTRGVGSTKVAIATNNRLILYWSNDVAYIVDNGKS